MYYKWIEWQQEAITDDKISKLSRSRHYTKVNLHHVQYELSRVRSWWQSLKQEEAELEATYCALDLELAEIDGRLVKICDMGEQLKKETKKKSAFKKALKKLSNEERLALIEELKNL